MKIDRVLSVVEYAELVAWCGAHDGYYSNDRRVFLPGMAWPCPWYFDPLGELKLAGNRREPMITGERKGELGFLSIHYWRDWADKRAPICVVCPNGETWEPDRKSSNGDGWIVAGDLPNITCSPSIVVTGYHGFLRAGEFTPDLEGRGPNGLERSPAV
jgi:hypothetical protein